MAIKVTWDSVTGAASYRVYRDDVLVDTVVTATYTDDSSLTPGVYTYKVSAGDALDNWSAKSTGASVNTTPSAAATIQAEGSELSVYVYWPAVPDATEYEVHRNNSPLTPTTSNLHYWDTTPSPGSYKYKVRAKSNGVWSDFSNEVTVQTHVGTKDPSVGHASTAPGTTVGGRVFGATGPDGTPVDPEDIRFTHASDTDTPQ